MEFPEYLKKIDGISPRQHHGGWCRHVTRSAPGGTRNPPWLCIWYIQQSKQNLLDISKPQVVPLGVKTPSDPKQLAAQDSLEVQYIIWDKSTYFKAFSPEMYLWVLNFAMFWKWPHFLDPQCWISRVLYWYFMNASHSSRFVASESPPTSGRWGFGWRSVTRSADVSIPRRCDERNGHRCHPPGNR